MPVDAARNELAREQAAMLRSLLRREATPPFAAGHWSAAADSLVHKRARAVAQAWPEIAEHLGERFAARFEAFAAERPSVRGAGVDGRRFTAWLGEEEGSAAMNRAALRFDLRFVITDEGVRPRRGLCIKVRKIADGRAAIGIRVGRWFKLIVN